MPAEHLQALPRDAGPGDAGGGTGVDGVLLGAALVLFALGLVMVASASVAIADRRLGDPLFFFWRQAAFAGVGIGLAWLAARVPLEAWRRASPVLLLLSMALLALVLVPGVGREVNGSVRWVALGPFNIQPSEPAKVLFVLYLAGYLVRHDDGVRSASAAFLRPLGLAAAVAVLLLAEPDYGATVVLFAATLGLLFLAGVPLVTFALWMVVVGLALATVVLLEPYRLARLLAFADPWADPYRSGFQLTQALIAVGHGGWLGHGLGAGVQKLFYLPEAHTDFLYAVIAEELGFAGAVLTLAAFAVILWRMFAIARRCFENGHVFGAHVTHGIALLIGFQAFVNIGVNLGLLPTKGLTLPLMSYGGSSLIVNCVAVAIALRAGIESRGRVDGEF